VPRSDALFSSAGVPVARFSVAVEEAPLPIAVVILSLPAVDPPADMLDELSAPAPAAEPPVPIAVDVLPLPAVAPPAPKVEAEPLPVGP